MTKKCISLVSSSSIGLFKNSRCTRMKQKKKETDAKPMLSACGKKKNIDGGLCCEHRWKEKIVTDTKCREPQRVPPDFCYILIALVFESKGV